MADEQETSTQAPAPVNAENAGGSAEDENLTEAMKKRIAKLREKEVKPLEEKLAQLEAQLNELRGTQDADVDESGADSETSEGQEVEGEAQEEDSSEEEVDSTDEPDGPDAEQSTDTSALVMQLRAAVKNQFSELEARLLTATTQKGIDEQVEAIKSLRSGKGRTSPIKNGVGQSRPAKPIYTRAQLANTQFYRANKADIELALQEGRIKD